MVTVSCGVTFLWPNAFNLGQVPGRQQRYIGILDVLLDPFVLGVGADLSVLFGDKAVETELDSQRSWSGVGGSVHTPPISSLHEGSPHTLHCLPRPPASEFPQKGTV